MSDPIEMDFIVVIDPEPGDHIEFKIAVNQDAKFPLGQTVLTRGVYDWAQQNPARFFLIGACLARHEQGDWGDVDDGDKAANDDDLEHGGRLVSAYTIDSTKVWLITEADRSATTALFPHEY